MSTTPSNNHSPLVTLAIHTFEKAQILKTMLEDAGIEASLQNVNQLLPVVSAGVRVRIKESDLPRALDLIEESGWSREDLQQELNQVDHYRQGKSTKAESYVLIPIDFSSYTPNVVQMGFKFAHRRQLRVVLLHAYFSRFFSVAPMFMGDVIGYQENQELNIKREYEHAQKKMESLRKEIDEMMDGGKLPRVPYEAVLKDGAPEEAILSMAKQQPPTAIVMGTRGKSRRSEDLLGSVAAEIIDQARVPVLIVPEEVTVTDLADLKHVGVATSFDQRDLILFDRMMQLFSPLSPSYKLFNISRTYEELGDVELRAIMEYHQEHYPDKNISYTQLEEGDFNEALDRFVQQEKIDLIVVNTYRRNLFARFFNPSIARRMLFHAGTPLLVMHSRSWR